MRDARTVLSIVLGIGLVCLDGCGWGRTDVRSLVRSHNDSNGKRLTNLYGQHQAEWNMGPKSEDAFRTFIASRSPRALEEMGVAADSLDGLFVSERDKQPFFIRYGLPHPGNGRQAVVLETMGVQGKSLVFFTGPTVIEVPTAELESYQKGEKDRAAN